MSISSGTRLPQTLLPGGKTIEFPSFQEIDKEFRNERFRPPANLRQMSQREVVQVYISWYSFYEKRSRLMDGYPNPSDFIGTSAI